MPNDETKKQRDQKVLKFEFPFEGCVIDFVELNLLIQNYGCKFIQFMIWLIKLIAKISFVR